MLLLVFLSCSTDVCQTMCADIAGAVERCLTEWDASWEDLDASSRTAWGDRCRTEWDAERTTLEPRQFDAAVDECQNAQEQLSDLTCEDLRALYLEP